MKNKEIEELLNDIKKQVTIDEKLGKEIAKDFHKTVLNYKEAKLLLSHIKELKEDNEYLKQLCETQNKREYRSKFLKEFQEEHGKNVYPDYDEIYKRYDEIKTELQEANESIIWWQNRFNAVERDKKQLENNRDKAIERIQYEEMFDYDNNHLINFKEELKYILLKGGSDE